MVFVHGNPGSSRHWDRLAEPAAAAIGDGAVLAPTLPGFAGEPVPAGFDYGVDAYADWLGSQIDAAGIDQAHLVMHDFGGAFGLTWAVRNPARLASLTLIDTGVLPGYRWHRLARIWRTPLLGEAFNAITNRRGFGRVINRGQATPLPEAFVDQLFDEASGATGRTVLRLYRATPAERLNALDRKFRMLNPPALVIWGDGDVYLPARYAQRQVENFPSADIHVLEGCGHWPHAEQPEAVEELLVSFLHQVTSHA